MVHEASSRRAMQALQLGGSAQGATRARAASAAAEAPASPAAGAPLRRPPPTPGAPADGDAALARMWAACELARLAPDEAAALRNGQPAQPQRRVVREGFLFHATSGGVRKVYAWLCSDVLLLGDRVSLATRCAVDTVVWLRAVRSAGGRGLQVDVGDATDGGAARRADAPKVLPQELQALAFTLTWLSSQPAQQTSQLQQQHVAGGVIAHHLLVAATTAADQVAWLRDLRVVSAAAAAAEGGAASGDGGDVAPLPALVSEAGPVWFRRHSFEGVSSRELGGADFGHADASAGSAQPLPSSPPPPPSRPRPKSVHFEGSAGAGGGGGAAAALPPPSPSPVRSPGLSLEQLAHSGSSPAAGGRGPSSAVPAQAAVSAVSPRTAVPSSGRRLPPHLRGVGMDAPLWSPSRAVA